MDVILVLGVENLPAFDYLNGMVLAVPPPAHDARADLQGEHRRPPPLRRVGLHRRLRAVEGRRFAVAGGHIDRTHGRER